MHFQIDKKKIERTVQEVSIYPHIPPTVKISNSICVSCLGLPSLSTTGRVAQTAEIDLEVLEEAALNLLASSEVISPASADGHLWGSILLPERDPSPI